MIPRDLFQPSRSVAALVIACSGLLGGCAPAQPRVYVQTAHVVVSTPAGEPLEGARITHDGQLLVRTAADGRARLQMAGQDGDAFQLRVGCPDGYEAAVTNVELQVLVRRSDAAVTPEFGARCARSIERAVVSVRAPNGANLPILYLGKEVGRTDTAGAATVTLDLRAGSEVDLVLDTREAKKLRPISPTLSFKFAARDAVVVLEQKFTIERPPPPRAAPSPPRGPKLLGG